MSPCCAACSATETNARDSRVRLSLHREAPAAPGPGPLTGATMDFFASVGAVGAAGKDNSDTQELGASPAIGGGVQSKVTLRERPLVHGPLCSLETEGKTCGTVTEAGEQGRQ